MEVYGDFGAVKTPQTVKRSMDRGDIKFQWQRANMKKAELIFIDADEDVELGDD